MQRAHLLIRLRLDGVGFADGSFVLFLPRFDHPLDLRTQKNDQHDRKPDAQDHDQNMEPRPLRDGKVQKDRARDERGDKQKNDAHAHRLARAELLFGGGGFGSRGIVPRDRLCVFLRTDARFFHERIEILFRVLLERSLQYLGIIFKRFKIVQ